MPTGTELIARIRENLDEPNEGQWLNSSLRGWINDGLDHIARDTFQLQDTATFTTVNGTAEYTMPLNVLRIDYVYYTTGDGRRIPITGLSRDSADAVWGGQQERTGEPRFFTTWGFAPNLKMRLYPVPIESGRTVLMHVARRANKMNPNGSTDSQPVDFVEGWFDVLVHYVEFRALRKDRDPRWQESYQLFTDGLAALAAHDDTIVNRDIVHDPAVIGGVPAYIADPRYPY
jgi:hypothetical protein